MIIKFFDWNRTLSFDEEFDEEEFEIYCLKTIFHHHKCYVEGACVEYFSKYNSSYQGPLSFGKKKISTFRQAKDIIYNSTALTFCKFFKTLMSYGIISIYSDDEEMCYGSFCNGEHYPDITYRYL